MKRRWHRVRMSELQEIWRAHREAGINFCGCTSVALLERYGAGNVKHVAGRGWYKLV